jgi:hypothetical protein
MKIAIFSESPADEAAVEILTAGILRLPVERFEVRHLRSRGWPSVLQNLPAVIKYLHYQTDADGLVVVVDSNHSQPHRVSGGTPCDDRCRLCKLRSTVDRAIAELRPVASRATLKVAVGMASPAIEAWYLCGKDPNVKERAWEDGIRSGSCPYTRNELKQRVYGTDRPSLTVETMKAVEEAKRLANDIDSLLAANPIGFGALVEDLKNW